MYRTIDASFWTDPKVRRLNATCKLAFLYLITNPHSHVGGIYYLPTVTATTETGLPRREWDRVCHTLSGAGLARFDEETEVVWVVNMLGYQARGEKADRAAANQLATLHNSKLIAEFLSKYAHVKAFVKDRVPVGHPAQDRFGTQEQDQEQEQKRCVGDTPKPSRFKPPSIEDARAYAAEKGYGWDVERFIDFYASKGWKVGRESMKDWKAAMRNWHKNEDKAVEPKGPRLLSDEEVAERNRAGYRIQ
jgi:hypothetical protein